MKQILYPWGISTTGINASRHHGGPIKAHLKPLKHQQYCTEGAKGASQLVPQKPIKKSSLAVVCRLWRETNFNTQYLMINICIFITIFNDKSIQDLNSVRWHIEKKKLITWVKSWIKYKKVQLVSDMSSRSIGIFIFTTKPSRFLNFWSADKNNFNLYSL